MAKRAPDEGDDDELVLVRNLADAVRLAEATGRDPITVRGWPRRYPRTFPGEVLVSGGTRIWRWEHVRPWVLAMWPDQYTEADLPVDLPPWPRPTRGRHRP